MYDRMIVVCAHRQVWFAPTGRVMGNAGKPRIQRMMDHVSKKQQESRFLTYGLNVHGQREDNLFWLMFGGMIRKL
jgi:hypothetical protein